MQQPQAAQDSENIAGYIERISFQSDESGYTVAQLKSPNRQDLVCIVGVMPSLTPGETVRCYGSWKMHLVHGRQFMVSRYTREAPADIIGIKKYLGSGLIRGIGPKFAERIVTQFGVQTLQIIDQAPESLLDVPGLGKKKIESIKKCWAEQRTVREVMVFLQTYGVSPSYAQKIFKVYGDQCIKIVKENPYALARDIFGIGFKTADQIAQRMGIEPHSSQRIDAGVEFALSSLSNEGHVCFHLAEFLVAAAQMLEVSSEEIQNRISFLKNEGRIELFELLHKGAMSPFIWLKPLFIAETGIAKEVKRLLASPTQLRQIDIAKALAWVQENLKLELAPQQEVAVASAFQHKMLIITGGPGTGKSTITKAILAIVEKLTSKIILTAPTGRAAKRMAEITGRKAATIHSLLEYNFKGGGFKRNRESPLDCDLVIVDEASMIDTSLMYSLLKAIPNHARVILVGDINQLPSVGPGNVLKDLIASQCLSVTTLNQIFRQAQGSRIVINAHAINQGRFPDINNHSDSDFFFIDCENVEDVLSNIVAMVTERLPRKYRLNPLQDIQVLSPMRRGIIGTENLNQVLQQSLNTNTAAVLRHGHRFLVGDKVMQTRNNYQKEVFNGDIGIIKSIDLIEQEVVVDFEARDVFYDLADLDELVLAYAVSIHKFQGSEYPCVIMPIHTTHFKLLCRNLLYTGVTRGKKLVVVIGTKKALALAVNNDEVKNRYSGLKQALIGTLTSTARIFS